MRAPLIRYSSRSIATSDSSWWILASGESPFLIRASQPAHRDPHDADDVPVPTIIDFGIAKDRRRD